MGYSVCMRLHWRLLFSRFGLFSIFPMFLTVVLGIWLYAVTWSTAVLHGKSYLMPMLLFPLLWLIAVCFIGTISALHHGKLRLIPLAPLAVLYVFLSYAIWIVHGFKAIFTGRELGRDKPTRYNRVVG